LLNFKDLYLYFWFEFEFRKSRTIKRDPRLLVKSVPNAHTFKTKSSKPPEQLQPFSFTSLVLAGLAMQRLKVTVGPRGYLYPPVG